jgi:hypothetical protein
MTTRTRSLWIAVGATAAVLAGLGLVAGFVHHRQTLKRGARTAPPPGTAGADNRDAAAALRRFADGRRGFVVWSSNRYGSHDILKLALPDLTVSRLTAHPHVDTFPRIAPDGTRVVFCRSQREWVSQRDPVPWDVYVLDLETGRETRVARSGNTPTWSDDGRSVFFQRETGRFVRHDLASGEETILFAAGRDGLPDGVALQTPAFSREHDALAVTLRGRRRATVVLYRDGRALHVGGGCQLVWTGINPPLCYVDHGGRQQNVIYAYDPATQTRTAWIDLPGALSHEYFPALSNDGTVLVFGASRGGRHDHEHDTADYEIFAWPVGAPAGSAVRLTRHTGNDCWPDIYLR